MSLAMLPYPDKPALEYFSRYARDLARLKVFLILSLLCSTRAS